MAFLVALGKLRGDGRGRDGEDRGVRNTREERHDQKRWMDEGDAAEGMPVGAGGGGSRDSARHRHPGAGD